MTPPRTRARLKRSENKSEQLKQSKSWKDYLKAIYYDPVRPASFQGINKLYEVVQKEKLFDISRKQIKQWLHDQPTYSLNKPVKRSFKRSRVIVEGIDDQFDADLIVALPYAKANNGIQYLLAVVDVFSKYAWAIPLKRKTGILVRRAFRKIFAQGRKPARIRTDRGSEFTNSIMKAFFEREKIFHFFTNNELQANYAERFIKTLKTKIRRYMTRNVTDKYVDIIQFLVTSYNETVHNTTGVAPENVDEENEKKLWWEMYWPKDAYSEDDRKVARRKVQFLFKVGDIVRIARTRRTLQREYDERWTYEVFIVAARFVRQHIPVYKLTDYSREDMYGTFYQSELQKVTSSEEELFIVEEIIGKRTRQGEKEVRVKWKGWPTKFNKWINEQDLKHYSPK